MRRTDDTQGDTSLIAELNPFKQMGPMHIHLPAEEAWSVFSGLGKFLRILPTEAADDLYWSLGNRRTKSLSAREIFSVHFCTKRSSSLSRSESSSEDAASLLASFLPGFSVKRGLELCKFDPTG